MSRMGPRKLTQAQRSFNQDFGPRKQRHPSAKEPMTRAAFDAWWAKASAIGDDEPLSDVSLHGRNR